MTQEKKQKKSDKSEQSENNYYTILGVKPNCTDAEVKKAYRELALKLHPDKNTSPTATEEFRKLKEASEALETSEKRQAYDKIRNKKRKRTEHEDENITSLDDFITKTLTHKEIKKNITQIIAYIEKNGNRCCSRVERRNSSRSQECFFIRILSMNFKYFELIYNALRIHRLRNSELRTNAIFADQNPFLLLMQVRRAEDKGKKFLILYKLIGEIESEYFLRALIKSLERSLNPDFATVQIYFDVLRQYKPSTVFFLQPILDEVTQKLQHRDFASYHALPSHSASSSSQTPRAPYPNQAFFSRGQPISSPSYSTEIDFGAGEQVENKSGPQNVQFHQYETLPLLQMLLHAEQLRLKILQSQMALFNLYYSAHLSASLGNILRRASSAESSSRQHLQNLTSSASENPSINDGHREDPFNIRQ